jgi:hypothetical protein
MIEFNHFQALFCINYMFCCYKKQEREKVNIFKLGVEKLKEKLNVTCLFKAYLDIEKLKYITMNTDQLVLFELVKNPKVNTNMIQKESTKIDTLTEFLLNKNNLHKLQRKEIDEYFERILKDSSEISKKILLCHSESM